MAGNLDRKLRLPCIHFRVLLHAANMRHGTNGFTSLPKEGVLRIFSPWKIRRLRPGLNSRTLVTKANTLPLDHRSRFRHRVNSIFALPRCYAAYFSNFLPTFRDNLSVLKRLRDIPEDRTCVSEWKLRINKPHKINDSKFEKLIKLYRVFWNALTDEIPHSHWTRRPALLSQFCVTQNHAASTLFYPDCVLIPHCSESFALFLLVAMNRYILCWAEFLPDHEITGLVTRNLRAINFQIYDYKTLFYFPSFHQRFFLFQN